MGATSLDLSQIKTDALSAASTFRTLIGLGNVNNTADADKPISTATQAALDLKANSSALASYLPLVGGTLTGGLSGTTATFSSNITGTTCNLNVSSALAMGIGTAGHILAFSSGSSFGFLNLSLGTRGTGFSDRCQLHFQPNHNMTGFAATQEGFYVGSGNLIGFSAANPKTDAPDTIAYRDAANTWGFRNGTNAQRINLYGTYTDANNYRRLYLSSTTAGTFTLGVEGLGTGASGNTLAIANSVTVSQLANHAIVGITSPAGWSSFISFSSNNTAFQTTFGLTGGNGHVFSNTTAGDFAIRSPQGRGIHFGADNGLGSATSGMFLSSTGNVGIGTSGPNVGLAICRSGTDLPSLRLEDGDITVPMTGLAINPTLNANTVSSWSAASSFNGGAQMNGFTNNNANAIAMSFNGYSGSASPVAPCLSFTGNKSDGGTGVSNLLGSELIAGFYAGNSASSPVVTVAANGAITASYLQTGTQATRYEEGGITSLHAGTRYSVISWTPGQPIQPIIISGFAYRGINIQRSTGLQTWMTVNLEGGSSAFGDTPRQALDVRGNAIVDGNLVLHRSATTTSLQVHNTFTDASNYIRQSLSFTTYSGTVYAQHVAEGLGTGAVNIPFVITPRGTGAFILGPMPDGTATGGNARGANAIDLQTSRSAATQVASGQGSFVCNMNGTASGEACWAGGGNKNGGCNVSGASNFAFGRAITNNASYYAAAFGYVGTMSSNFGFAVGVQFSCTGAEYQYSFGRDNVNTGAFSLTLGANAVASRQGERAFAIGNFANQGDAQHTQFVLRIKTTNNTPTTLLLGPTQVTSTTRLTIPSGKVFAFVAKISGIKSDGTAVAFYTRKGCIKNVGGTTSLVGDIEMIGNDVEDNPNTDVDITADNTNDALDISVTGITGETWRWVAVVEGVEVAYGT